MGIDFGVLEVGSLILGGLGTAMQTVGSIQQGRASAAAANYNAEVAANNAKTAQQNAAWAGAAGESQAEQAGMKTRATVGAIKAAQAANNISVNSGAAVDVRSSAAELGELSAINIRSNAARTAYGYQTKAASETAQSELDRYQAGQDQIAGEVGAASSILGGAGNSGSNYARFLQQNSPLNGSYSINNTYLDNPSGTPGY